MNNTDSGFIIDEEIIKRGKRLLGPDFEPNQAGGASYDLSLGEEVYISGEDSPRLLSDANPFVSIPRGQFALLLTKEYVRVPDNHLGFISIRFGKKAQGLVNISGFHVDPGFEGKIIFSVFNAGPTDVTLKYGEPIFMIFFYKLQRSVLRPYKGDRQGLKSLPTALVSSVKGVSASLSDVDRRVSRLEIERTVIWTLLIAVIVCIVTSFLTR